MPASHRVRKQFHTHFRLGGLPAVALEQKRRITADLPQLCEFCKYLNLFRSEFLIGLLRKTLPHALHVCIVERKLLSGQLCENIFLQLCRKIAKNLPL